MLHRVQIPLPTPNFQMQTSAVGFDFPNKLIYATEKQ